MKNLRKLFAVALLVLTLGLPAYADGQMETPRPTTPGHSQQSQTTLTEDVNIDGPLTQSGQMETPKTAVLCLIESILALI